ncbi:DUF4879 domain-containing protein [Bacillus velezensis]|uniref:DUF4879 domain-containing protein n=1 Tax=Bacillus velezensis TaxID=492670 RepID=UPI0033956F9C
MKKVFSLVTIVLLAVATMFSINTSKAEAVEATPLYSLQILSVTSDGNDFVWEPITSSKPNATNVLKGDKLHIKVRFMGYTNSTAIKAKDGRNLLYKGEANIYKYDPILGQNKVVIGWDKYIEIPMNELPSNEIQVEGLGKNMKIIYSNVVKFERG